MNSLVVSGCELNDSNKEEFFKTDDTNHQHQLALRTVGSVVVEVNVTFDRCFLHLTRYYLT